MMTSVPIAAVTAPPLPLMASPLRGVVYGLLAATIWGAYLAMAKSGLGHGLHASDIAAVRYGTAGLVMLPWMARHGVGRLREIGTLRALALTILVGPLFILIGVGGYGFAPLAHGAVVQPAALTLGAIGLAALLLGERPTPARIAGIGVILAGLVVIAGPGLLGSGHSTLTGDVMFAAAGLMWALFTVLSRRWSVPPIAGAGVVAVFSAILFLPIYAATDGPARLLSVPVGVLAAQVLVQGLLSGVVAVVAFSRAAVLLGAGKAAVFPALVPAVAILIGIPLTGEWPTATQLVGLALVTAGLLITVAVVRRGRS